jgi:hypothetical protein
VTHRFRRIPFASAFAASLVLVLAGVAMAAAGWSQPQQLEAPQTIPNAPEVAANANNVVVATWYQFTNQGKDVFVRAAVRQRGERFSSPVTLGPAKVTIGGNVPSFANGAVDGRGDVAVTWLDKDSAVSGKLRVVVAYKPAEGQFGAPQAVSPAEFDSFQPQIAVNERGDFAVVWQRFDNGRFQVQAAMRRKGQAGFGAPITLSSPEQDSQFPRVGMASDGRSVVAWRATAPRAHPVVQAVSVSPSGGPSSLQALSDPKLVANRPRLATAPSGKTMVVWAETNFTTEDHVAGAFSSSDGRFGAEQVLGALHDHSAGDPRVGLDGRGAAVIVWVEIPSPGKTGDDFVRVATANGNGGIGSPQDLFRAGRLVTPSVAVSPGGIAVATWVEDVGPTSPVLSAIRPAIRETFRLAGAVTPAGTSGEAPALTASASVATAAWVRHSTDGYSVETSHRSFK